MIKSLGFESNIAVDKVFSAQFEGLKLGKNQRINNFTAFNRVCRKSAQTWTNIFNTKV